LAEHQDATWKNVTTLIQTKKHGKYDLGGRVTALPARFGRAP
jgi:hypothetical protein